MNPEETFWGLVDRSGGPNACWPWLGGSAGDGYGRFQGERAHRWALRLDGRPVLPGQVGRHLCFNPICCNPAHLAPGSKRDDIMDSVRAGRLHNQRNLSQEQADCCRAWYRRGLATADELARIFGIGPQRVRKIGTDEPYRRRNDGQRSLFEAMDAGGRALADRPRAAVGSGRLAA